jgi:hypothetical protein
MHSILSSYGTIAGLTCVVHVARMQRVVAKAI